MKPQRRYLSVTWTWISFIVFGLIISLLASSLYLKKSPAKVLASLFTKDIQVDNLETYPKKDLIQIIENQNKLIDSLQVRLSGYIENFGPGRAKIDVSVEALNMRSEPSLSGDVLSRIPNGSIVGVLYFDDKEQYLDGATGKWCRIKYIGQEGWVWGNYLILLE
jgi:hypothetical protein